MPVDSAFDVLEPGTLDRLRRNTRLLRRLLLNQMIEGKVNMTDVDEKKDRPVRSLGGTIVISSVDNGKVSGHLTFNKKVYLKIFTIREIYLYLKH